MTKKTPTQLEFQMIEEVKEQNPHLRHRQIQGVLQERGHYLSPTSVYHHLKEKGLIEPYHRREAAWKEARYEVYRANLMWGADWTEIRVGGVKWYLLTLIDFFSRMLLHFEVLPTVTSANIVSLYRSGLLSEGMSEASLLLPELRVDQGSPNTARRTLDFFQNIQAEISYARVRRPTDNARTERFYRTIKEEEIYLVGDYLDQKTAQEEIAKYVKWYNENRPHQSLWNFTPHEVHRINNKTKLLEILRERKERTWNYRKEYWRSSPATEASD